MNKIKEYLFELAFPEKAWRALMVILALPLITVPLFLVSNHVYVSNGSLFHFLNDTGSPVWDLLRALSLPGIDSPGPLLVEQVNVTHIIPNAVFVVCTSACFALVPLAGVLLVVVAVIVGVISADWIMIIKGAVIAVIVPISAIAILFMPLTMWLEFLLQSCTPAYALIWIAIGLPTTLVFTLFPAAAEARLVAVVLVFKR